MTLNEYQQLALETAIYPNGLYHDSELGLINKNNGIFIIFYSTPHIIIFILIQYILNGRNNYKPIIIQWIVWLEGFIIIYYKYHRKTGLLSKRK